MTDLTDISLERENGDGSVSDLAGAESKMRNSPDERIRIGFVHRFDAQDIRSWSGTLYFMARALEEHVGDVLYLGPDQSPKTRFIVNSTARVNRLSGKIFGKRLVGDHNRILSMRLATYFQERLREVRCDILFAPAASVEISHLRTDLPIIYLSDLTWKNALEYYPELVGLSAFDRAEGERIEAAAIRKSDAVIFPSEWAAQTATSHYGANENKVHRIPFGANMEKVPSREVAMNHKLSRPLRLLWVGVDWQRKGGPIALACLAKLCELGIDTELTVVGCVPPASYGHPRMHVIPFLNKAIPEQLESLSRLFLESHFLLFPTNAEALGIASCESSAHGLPCLVNDTGGVRGAVRDGINGLLMPHGATGNDYAERIASMLKDPNRYQAMVESSRIEYEGYLNWDSWGRAMRKVVTDVLSLRRLAASQVK
jgi:glycosyltransferase involved in cell wall biosynthesis